MKQPQLTLSREMIRNFECGGDYSIGKRKTRRPYSRRAALHVVARADRARGQYSLLLPKNKRIVESVLLSLAKRFHIQIYDKSINTNHCHLLLRAPNKWALSAFLRAFPGIIAMKVTGAKKGSPILFWSNRIWSRIVNFGRDFYRVRKYIFRNVLEAEGVIPYTPRIRRKTGIPSLMSSSERN